MKKIGIDARLINQTGVGVYIRNLLHNIDSMSIPHLVYVYLRDEDKDTIQFNNSKIKKRSANFHWHSFSEQVGFLYTLYQDNLDLMHFTYFSFPILYHRPFIITIHDLIPLVNATGAASTKNPLIYRIKKMAYTFVIKAAIKKSRSVIVPSYAVKKSVLAHFEAEDKKIVVTYEGVTFDLINTKQISSIGEDIAKPFFIYIGNFYPHKNVANLLKAFAKAKVPHSLILIGPSDYFSAQIRSLAETLNTHKIHFYHNPRVEDFAFFYKNAYALIHPSLNEGFGLPLVEASYFGCPIVASNIETFSEIMGDHFLSFDPRSISDIRQAIEEISQKNDTSMYMLPQSALSDKYSFKLMSEKTVKLYTSFI